MATMFAMVFVMFAAVVTVAVAPVIDLAPAATITITAKIVSIMIAVPVSPTIIVFRQHRCAVQAHTYCRDYHSGSAHGTHLFSYPGDAQFTDEQLNPN
ncbi:MAG: hypothetical protein HUJ31_17030 [Pseudomonadales bacterium]|nr:hypothetical protein [Pseudomonadales bacterium]